MPGLGRTKPLRSGLSGSGDAAHSKDFCPGGWNQQAQWAPFPKEPGVAWCDPWLWLKWATRRQRRLLRFVSRSYLDLLHLLRFQPRKADGQNAVIVMRAGLIRVGGFGQTQVTPERTGAALLHQVVNIFTFPRSPVSSLALVDPLIVKRFSSTETSISLGSTPGKVA